MPKGMDILSASCYRGKAPNFLMKRHLRNLRKNTPLHKLLREVMLLNEQWEEARTAHADARTSMNPQLATNFAKTVIPAVNDKLRSNLTNYVLNEALKQVQASAIYGVALCSIKQDRPCVPSGHTIELERGADLAGLPRFSSITEALAGLHLTSAASAAHALYVIYTKCTINNGRSNPLFVLQKDKPGGQQLRRNVAASDRSFTEASVGWAADQQKDGRM
eukprot:jgi/Tetstr1/420976/TSEL_012036.t1